MIKGRAQQTLTKVFDGSGIFSIVLTNENTSVPVSDKGLALNYSATPTDVYVYSGTNLLSPVASNPEAGEFTLTASGENIIAGRTTINGNVVSIGNASDMVDNKDSYSITVTASGKDFLGNPFSSQKKQVIIPLKHGDDATSYWVTSTSSVITKDVKGAMNPAQFTVSALSQSGFNDPSAYKGIFKVYTKTGISFSDTPDYVSSSPESSHTVAPSNTTNDIKVELYDNNGNILLDSQTVPVITQANGVISTKIQYTVTDTVDKPTDSASWSDNFPSVGKGQYLWSRTTFYYTDGSTAVSYSMGRTGADGASAPLLFLSSDNQAFTFSGDGKTPNPTNQVITFVANLQNIQGTATFVATPYLNGAAGTPIGLGGSGNSRTLSIQQFGSTYDSVVVKASLGNLSDTETVYKLKDGSNGIQGPAGADGKSTYIHLAYANSSDGKQEFSISNGTNKSYIGTYTDQNSTGTTDYTKYTWSLIKGRDGSDGTQGIQGPAGADGKPTYVHFAYANSSDGKQEFSTIVSQGKAYIGVYSDNVSANSTDYTKYTWSLVKGSDGVDAVSGWLTNESITLAADSNGNVPSYTGASGSFVVYYGINPITNLVISASNTVGMTISISGMNYTVTSMTTDIAYTDLSVSYQGTTITKRLTISKSKAGMTGADGTSVVNSTTPPKNPTQGQWWNDLSVTPNVLKVYQQGNWVPYRIDAINLVAKSVTTDRLASDVLMASNVTFTNKNGTSTNLQTFNFDGIQTLLSDGNGNVYTSMESAVGSTQTVQGIRRDLNNLGQINQLVNTEFSPDFSGWYNAYPNPVPSNTVTTELTKVGPDGFGSNVVSHKNNGSWIANGPITVTPGTPVSISARVSVPTPVTTGVPLALYIMAYDTNNNRILSVGYNIPVSQLTSTPKTFKFENQIMPSGTTQVYYLWGWNVNDEVHISQPMLVFSQSIGTYAPGPYNNDDKIVTLSVGLDGVKATAGQNTDDIAKLKLDTTEFNASITKSVTTAQSTADAASSKIDNLQVGGSNLFLGSKDFSDDSNWNIKGTLIENVYQGLDAIQTTGAWGGPKYYNSSLERQGVIQSVNDTFVMSAWIRNTGTAPITIYFYGDLIPESNKKIVVLPANSTWMRVKTNPFSFSQTSGLTGSIRFEPTTDTTNGYVQQVGLKLEKGNTTTAWTPAPEDIASATAKAQNTANTAASGVADLVDKTQWKSITTDNMDKITAQGNYFVTGDSPANAPIQPWFYLKVDTPRSDRMTQTIWKDLDSTLSYIRSFGNNAWSSWSQNVTSTTMVQLLGDNWSIGTTQTTATTQKIITSINGQADGTLVVKGSSVILDADTVFAPNFVTTLLNAQDATIGKTLTIAPGGSLSSDVIHMDKDKFAITAPNISSYRLSSDKYKVSVSNGIFNIDSVLGSVSSDGNISVAVDSNSQPYKRGIFHSEYNSNNLMMSATNYTNGDKDEQLNISASKLDYMYSKTGFMQDATDHTSITANSIETTGTLNAFGVTQTPRVYSWPNLTLESLQQSVLLKAGNNVILQVRENGYMYMLTRHSGSGGVSLQVAGDGALFMQSSSTKFKTDIQYDGGTSVGDKFLTLDPATWQDKDEYEQRKLYRESGIEPTHQIHMDDKRYYGLIAEDLVKAGLEEFVVRDEVTGEVNGLEYDKVAISLIPIVRDQRKSINELRVEVERLKDNTK